MPVENEQVLLGRVIATHGIRGQLRVVPFSGEPETILSLGAVILKTPDGKEEFFAVTAAAAHGKKVILTLGEFSNINQVLHLVGRDVYAERGQLPELSADEYYWCDLMGLLVRTVSGVELGKICDIFATGSSDIYVVRGGEKEYLIPAVEDVVLDISLEDGVMTVDPPEGLLDL